MQKYRIVQTSNNSFGQVGVKLFSVIRNEKIRLPFFIQYYRQIGVSEFYFIDNASTDGTMSYLQTLKSKTIHLFSYTGSYDYLIKHEYEKFIKNFGNGFWCLCVDPDEFLAYPFMNWMKLGTLTGYLDAYKYTSMSIFLLDMYSKKPILETRYLPGQNPFGLCQYFDKDTHYLMGYQDSLTQDYYGGVRKRVFGLDKVSLSKSPLLKMSSTVNNMEGFHHVLGTQKAPFRVVLFHFKFIHSFVHRVPEEAIRGEHWNNAFEYKFYARKNLKKLMLYHPDFSEKFTGLTQLLLRRIIALPLSYLLFAIHKMAKKYLRVFF